MRSSSAVLRPETMGSGGMFDEKKLTLTERRARFSANWARGLAEQAGRGNVTAFTNQDATKKLSGLLDWYRARGRMVVLAGPNGPRDVDLALAFGLHHVRPEDTLVVVVPADESTSRATLARAPFINRSLEVWTYDLDALERGESVTTERRPLDSPDEVFAKYRDAEGWAYGTTRPRPGNHVSFLGEQGAWVEDLTSWLEADDRLDAEHTDGYLAWKCRGKIVLRIQRTRRELTLTAGIQYSDPAKTPTTVPCTGLLSPVQLRTLEAAVSAAVEELADGFGGRYPEHRLQAAISHLDPPILGLANSPVPECAAWRPYAPPSGRAFLDFLGVDPKGTLHVLETKVGGDKMMVLQGLDYWIWAMANWDGLVAQFGLGNHPKVEVDFVLSQKGTAKLPGPYTKAQSQALAPEVVHQFWEISNWDQEATPEVKLLDV